MKYYNSGIDQILQVEVTGPGGAPFQYQIELPRMLAANLPLVVGREKKGTHWNMNSIELATADGLLVRFVQYEIMEKEVVLKYNVSTIAACFRIQYQGSSRFHVTSKKAPILEEGHYNIFALKSNEVKVTLEKGRHQVVEIYVAGKSMDILKPYFYNYWTIERRQKAAKMVGKTAYFGRLNQDVHEIVQSMWQHIFLNGEHLSKFIKYPIVHLFALATREQLNHGHIATEHIFDYCTKWDDYFRTNGSPQEAVNIVSCSISNSDSTFIKGAWGAILLQVTHSNNEPVWNFVSYLKSPCSLHIYPNRFHYSMVFGVTNNVQLQTGEDDAFTIKEGQGKFLAVHSYLNRFYFPEGKSRIIQLHFETPHGKINHGRLMAIGEKLNSLEGKLLEQAAILQNLHLSVYNNPNYLNNIYTYHLKPPEVFTIEELINNLHGN